MLSGSCPSCLTSRRFRPTIHRASHQFRHFRPSRRCCHHCCHPSRSCHRFRCHPTNRRYSDRRTVSQCCCQRYCRPCLTNQSAPTRCPCRPLPRPRRLFLRNLSCRRILSGRPRYRATTIRLTSFPMSRSTIRPAIQTCSACRRRDPSHRRLAHDFGSGPPWCYPPTYFDCDLQGAADASVALWGVLEWQRMCQGVM